MNFELLLNGDSVSEGRWLVIAIPVSERLCSGIGWQKLMNLRLRAAPPP